MFVYYVSTTIFSFIRFLGPVYRLLVWLSVRQLQRELSQRIGESLSLSIAYKTYWPEVILIAERHPTRDWKPQFRFCIRRDMRGVVLDSLKFPGELRGRGLGRFCVRWLKKFCRWFGFAFIVLGSYPEAEGFWKKMKFTMLEYPEWSTYWK
ncbi:hypothetical protein AXX12_00955 [Anaerosporomusa subterranea]|uniref:N-acetyltransferase domain-containing protein n=1 Tax=Anaerosporomusa subterranea TaxID=1794912 RepID=A0A154BW92_ANASB|nr:hypothetical protein [Anaerosporomusa subterranea]KYZ78145.1 hypothetical protein AXX12_00955 [Anaerosporomusa subterranea]